MTAGPSRNYPPKPVPRRLALSPEVAIALSEADAALGLLNGVSRLIVDPEVLLGPFLAREALASSRIEGTNATLTEVVQAEAAVGGRTTSDDVDEVERYLAATRQGMELAASLPIPQRLIRQTHTTLVQGVRGAEKQPGELRRTPVRVGPPGASPDQARIVPPLPEHLPHLMADWERFANEPATLPVLVRCALMHYQFEDAVWRTGRLVELREKHQEQCRLDRPRISALVPLIFTTPFLSVRRVQRSLEMSAPGARTLLVRAEALGWSRPLGITGRDGCLAWVAQDVLDVIEAPSTYGG